MKWIRTVTYSVRADTLEEALDAWGEDGPELGHRGRVAVEAGSNFELEPTADDREQIRAGSEGMA